MLQAWEAGDEEVVSLWRQMNGWVYEGFDATYQNHRRRFRQVLLRVGYLPAGQGAGGGRPAKRRVLQEGKRLGVGRFAGRGPGRKAAAPRRRHQRVHHPGPGHGRAEVPGFRLRQQHLRHRRRAELPHAGAAGHAQKAGQALRRRHSPPQLRHGGPALGQDEIARRHRGGCRRAGARRGGRRQSRHPRKRQNRRPDRCRAGGALPHAGPGRAEILPAESRPQEAHALQPRRVGEPGRRHGAVHSVFARPHCRHPPQSRRAGHRAKPPTGAASPSCTPPSAS